MSHELSIIVPVYNAASLLRRLVSSIKCQTFQDFEVLLIDDGSKDDSLELCKEISREDERFKVFHTNNQGAGPARNLGISKAEGRWAYFPDADDEFLDERFLETLMERAHKSDADLLVFGYQVRGTDGRLQECFLYPDLRMDGQEVRLHYERHIAMDSELAIQGAPWNKLFKMSLIRTYSIEYPSLRRHQDECFISRYMQFVGNVEFLPLVGYVYYSNDSKKVNKKYPVDYIESVKGLYHIRRETILKWNPDNEFICSHVSKELFCNMIHAFELSFHRKFGFSRCERVAWMRKHLEDVDYRNLNAKLIYKRPYHNVIFRLLPSHFMLAYYLICLKYHVQSLLG